ncbi:hypothetical protein F3D3_4462 [Fusibacter sp. 3D3]|nr:hypothetical protein F3D3_4462 [Fusibacter sp. 3D3]
MRELDELMSVANTWENKVLTEGEAFTEDYFIKAIEEGDLPPIPNASRDHFDFYSILKKDTLEIIGFMEIYMGYPDDKTLWIGMFVIDSSQRRNHYGHEIISNLNTLYTKLPFSKVGVGVSLKNWRGLRFWHKMGFNTLFNVAGDIECTEETHALIGLIKSNKLV